MNMLQRTDRAGVGSSVPWLRLAALLAAVLCLSLGLSACVTKSAAKAQARAAYLAGQQEAMNRMQQAQAQGQMQEGALRPVQAQGGTVPGQGGTVQISGPVRSPVVPWTPGLTLMRAIVAADYTGATDPAEILLVRNGIATRVDVHKLLSGEDVPVQPNDVVQLVLPQPGTAKVQP